MYEELVKRLREPCQYENCILCQQAADAIEKLQGQIDGWIEQERKVLLKSVPKWIPVTERLPELHEEALVCNEDYGLSGLGFAIVAVWDGTDWLEAWNRRDAIHYITHWMPLPEPPEEETE